MEHSNFFPHLTFDEKRNLISIETWHPLNGEWVHILADYKNKKFYTNGKEE
jgi:hypothetical protein